MKVTPFAAVGLSVLFATPAPAAEPSANPAALEFFESKVRPVLADNCYSCHGPQKQKNGLRLDSGDAVRRGGDNGPVLAPGDPDHSRIVQAVRQTGELKMPPKGKLRDAEIDALAAWVKMGAPWPAPQASARAANADDPATTHWAFQPVHQPATPEIPNPKSQIRNPIDAFVLAKLQAAGLAPSPEADRATLLRRVTLDLTGLPPAPAEVDAFISDPSPNAYEKVIDRLLASPAYGERWGRHWLDVARYADSKGYVFQEERRYPYAYTYRDYVIRAFNDDKPYDRFILEQLAADKLPLGDDKHPLAALGFLTLGRRFLNNVHDIIDDRIDVVTRGFLGLTVQCARCHDHKYDPIPQKDYYSLYGVFASSVEPKDLPLLETPQRTPELIAFEKELDKRRAEVEAFKQKRLAEVLAKAREPAQVADYLQAAQELRGQPEGALRAKARDRNLAGIVLSHWVGLLTVTAQEHDPLFAAWHDLTKLPEADFAARAAAYRPAHPTLAWAFAERPPATPRELAQVYGAVIADLLRDTTPATAAERERFAGPHGVFTVAPTETDQAFNRADRDKLRALAKRVEQFQATSPAAPPRGMVLTDAPRPVEPHVFLRGNPINRGPAVPRQFLGVLAGPDRQPFTHGSGRLDLAKAIADPANPLTARVFVNRVWEHHFGKGLVGTPSDFGLRSDPPIHPELLDWLADRFVRGGWSVKALHKLILLSHTYRQRSDDRPECAAADPENRLLWKFNRQRLDLEALRDSMLAVAGRLEPTVGGPAVDLLKEPFVPRRTVYGFIDRQNLPGMYRTFDFASPDTHAPRRYTTTVPQQALFLMNSPFVVQLAQALAARPEVAQASPAEPRVEALYRLLYGRPPSAEEVELGVRFIDEASRERERPEGGAPATKLSPWEQYTQVLLLANEFAFVD
jgi:mono/diheme cytochrome c family protein